MTRARPAPWLDSPCPIACRPHVSAETCLESVCPVRWRYMPPSPFFRDYAPLESVRAPFCGRDYVPDAPPDDAPGSKSEHDGEPIMVTARYSARRHVWYLRRPRS